MKNKSTYVTIVSGLPRSGTSLMMQMLEAGGLPVLTDGIRQANVDNPKGYYELERVKDLPNDKSWVGEATGKAVKVIYKLVKHLPANFAYRIVFMQRDLEEVLRSQEHMLANDGLAPGILRRDALLQHFQTDVMAFRRWAEAQKNISLIYVDYQGLMDEPAEWVMRVCSFLGVDLDCDAMAAVVDHTLYRNRSAAG